MLPELPEEFLSRIDHEAGSVLLWTARVDSSNRKSYLFRNCRAALAARTPEEIPGIFAQVEAALADGCYVAGFLSYECAAHFEPRSLTGRPWTALPGNLPLAWFGVYDSPRIFEHGADGLSARPGPLGSAAAPPRFREREENIETAPHNPPRVPALDLSVEQYRKRVERIKRYIEAGDAYQINLTTDVKLPLNGNASTLLSALLNNQPVAYGALLNLGETQIVSASPELFFRLREGALTTQPMKGTAPRGRDIDEDAAIAAWLEGDEKNRSENVMIVDLLRNDLGRVCIPGSVVVEKLFAVEKFPTLFQMTSTIGGRLLPGAGIHEIFKALFPCGSIVGAPKVRAMQIVQELEGRPRGIYTGAIGFISPQREAVFSVAIRTLVLRAGMAEMGVGSGIVYDSDAEAEYEECKLKAAFLARAPVDLQLIETMLWDREYLLLGPHLERLAASAAYFDFAFDRGHVSRRLSEFAESLEPGLRYRVRLLMEKSGHARLSSSLLEDPARPLAVSVTAERVMSSDLYRRHKTTHRHLYDAEFAKAKALGFDDALFLNERDEVAEGAIHNIVIEKNGQLLTPPPNAGILPGVYRRHLLETRSNLLEATLTLDDLRAADRIFMCNSVRGLHEVGSIRMDDRVLYSRRPAGTPA